MSGKLLRLVCTAAIAAGTALAPTPATATPEPGDQAVAAPVEQPPESPDNPTRPSVAELLTRLQLLYREAEKAAETYNATEEKLKKRRAETERLERALARARLSLYDSRRAAGRLARQQYQSSTDISPYVRLLLAREPQRALEQGHVIGQLARERAKTVGRLTDSERRADELARRARKALDAQLALTERRKKERDDVRRRLHDVEALLASLTADQLTALAAFETSGIAEAQRKVMASGVLGGERTPSAAGARAVRHAVRRLGKPYQWSAGGPESYDGSGLTSRAWGEAGTRLPRTGREQWERLTRIPLSELRPGDLVVHFPEATHAAMYLGDGMVVQAPRPGARVTVSPLAAYPVLGAVRPDPDGKPLRRYTPPELPEGALDDGPGAGYAAPAPETSAR